MRTFFFVTVFLWATSCGAPIISAPPTDAGLQQRPDAGTIETDAGVDAGPIEVDAGVEDAGTFDDGGEDGDFDGGEETYDAGFDPPDEDAGTPIPDAGVEPEITVVEATYRVLHWNIAGGKENDCRTDLIARAVRRFVVNRNIDFVSLNELCPGQYEAIRDELRTAWGLGGAASFSAYQGDGTPRIVGNGIYARFGFAAVTRQQLGTDQYGTRNLLCGRVTGEPHLRFCSAHLAVSDTVASAQMRAVLTRLEDWGIANGDTVLLAGDLNLTANHAGLDPVYSSNVDTPNNRNNTGRYRELDDADPVNCLGYGEHSTPGTAGGPCSTGGKIDFVFVRQNRIVNDDYDGDTLDIPTDCTGDCSDHRPVTGHVKVKVRRD